MMCWEKRSLALNELPLIYGRFGFLFSANSIGINIGTAKIELSYACGAT